MRARVRGGYAGVMRGATLLLTIWLCAGCKGESPRELKVSAAMSLKEVLTELEPGFEERYAGAAELGRPGLRLVLAGPGVPAGAYARVALRDLGIETAALANLVSNEENVRGVLGKVSAGEADVGIVYATDVTPAMVDKVRVLPVSVSVEPRYQVATLIDSPEASLAAAFVAMVQGPDGQMALARRGFLPP